MSWEILCWYRPGTNRFPFFYSQGIFHCLQLAPIIPLSEPEATQVATRRSAQGVALAKNEQGGGARRFILNKALQGGAVTDLLSLWKTREDLHEAGGAEAPRTQADTCELGQGSCTHSVQGLPAGQAVEETHCFHCSELLAS